MALVITKGIEDRLISENGLPHATDIMQNNPGGLVLYAPQPSQDRRYHQRDQQFPAQHDMAMTMMRPIISTASCHRLDVSSCPI